MSKTLVIGDIHGCYDELRALLDKVPLTSADQIIHIGDFVDRGPKPYEVLDFFMQTPNASGILGNRDYKHIRAYDGDASYTGARLVTRGYQFPDEDAYAHAIMYLRTLPLSLELDAARLVHAYYEPDVPFAQQRQAVLLGTRSAEQRLAERGYSAWYEHYQDDKPLIMGHRAYDFFKHPRTNVYALDTRCVYGGALTGLLLPDFEVYSVAAYDNHWLTLQHRYPQLLLMEDDDG